MPASDALDRLIQDATKKADEVLTLQWKYRQVMKEEFDKASGGESPSGATEPSG